MDISTDQYKSDENLRPAPFYAVSHTVRDVVRWLARFLNVSEEDLSDAGIFLGVEGRD